MPGVPERADIYRRLKPAPSRAEWEIMRRRLPLRLCDKCRQYPGTEQKGDNLLCRQCSEQDT
jgi:hypothetical protein